MTLTPAHARMADRVALVWASAVALLVALFAHRHAFDDPFITYRYAANLARGVGFVYNQGEPVLSTTAPLYALFLTPFAAAGLALPLVSNLLGCVSLGAGALALWHLGKTAAMPVAGAVAALLFPLSPLMLSTLGAETAPLVALVLWGFWAAWQGRAGLAAGILAAATLTRADAALAVILAGALILARRGRRKAMVFGGTFGLAVAPFLLAAWWYFGTPVPSTFGAKRSQGRIQGSRSFFDGLVTYIWGLRLRILFWPLLGLAPIGVVAAVMRRGPLALVLLWAVLHAAAYSLLGVTAYFWYYGPALTGLVVAAALGAQLLADWLGRRFGRPIGLGAAATLATIALAGHLVFLVEFGRGLDQRPPVYRAAGEWLRANTAPGEHVGALEVGIIGYYSERPMIDFAGLLQPELARVFDAGGSYAEAAMLAIERYRPAYLANQERSMPLVTANPTLAAVCSEVAAIPDPRYPTPLQIFRCDWQ